MTTYGNYLGRNDKDDGKTGGKTGQQTQTDPKSVANNAGGFVYQTTLADQFERFLILGSGATYYASKDTNVMQHLALIERAVTELQADAVRMIVDVGTRGRANKQSPVLLALAFVICKGNKRAKANARLAFPQVARTASHLYEIVEYIDKLGGWGRGKKATVNTWFDAMSVDNFAYQAIKYKERNGWKMRDIMRLSHPDPSSPTMAALYDYVTADYNATIAYGLPEIVLHYRNAHRNKADAVLNAISSRKLSWEMLPSESLKNADTWKYLVRYDSLPYTAMLRNLGRMAAYGVFDDTGIVSIVANKLTQNVRQSKAHPIAILLALKMFAQGRGNLGRLTWTPNATISTALDMAFYASFENVERIGGSAVIGVDVSGSMSSPISGVPLTAREGVAAISMVLFRMFDDVRVYAFSSQVTDITDRLAKGNMTIEQFSRMINLPYGSTDCAAPILKAGETGFRADVFVTLTDNETWAGRVKPIDALRQYRRNMGIPAVGIAAAVTATEYSIFPDDDPLCLNVVGFDPAITSVIADMVKSARTR